jgi:hypothetical protein
MFGWFGGNWWSYIFWAGIALALFLALGGNVPTTTA